MKKYLFVIIAALALTSCEDIQDNNPGLQGQLNQTFFRANDARATANDNGSYVIQGYTQDETLTLRISSPTSGIYELGGDSKNFASYEDGFGNIRVTSPDGDGEIEVTRWDTSDKTLSGLFRFTTYTGNDTLVVHSGVFNGVSYAAGLNEPADPIDTTDDNAGTFVASVDGMSFNPIAVTAVEVEESIILTGESATSVITLELPVNAQIGSYALPRNRFNATITDINGTEEVETGNIIVIGNDPITRKIKGTFSFETENHSVTIGQFNVRYE